MLVALTTVLGLLLPSTAAVAATPVVRQGTATTASADALPTTQINGVVWSQVIIGTTVYVGGSFTKARPAGAAPGTRETTRSNLLAYDVRTGVLIDTFKPALNGMVKTVVASADKRTLYVGGAFTKVGTTTRQRFAAFSVATGALTKAAPSFNSDVKAITASTSSVYVGGSFTAVNGVARSRLAALRASDGALTSWAPKSDVTVQALVLTPDQTKVIAGGAFSKLNTTTAYGSGALDAKTGKTLAWKVNATVRNHGQKSAVLSLSADADTVYGTTFSYGDGQFEGVYAADPKTGAIRWLQDCHGDTYGAVSVNDVVYSVGHAHQCANIGGFADTSPRSAWYRAMAVSKKVGGTVAKNTQKGYSNFGGQPAPSMVNWFPNLTAGTVTGKTQAAWSIAATSQYVVLGGEFPAVNGVAQQGLVRFVVRSKAAGKMGPQVTNSTSSPTVTQATERTTKVSWTANWDRDDTTLRYDVLRDGVVVATQSATNPFWSRPTLGVTDAVVPATTYRYAIRATDPDGNSVVSPAVKVETPSSSAYPDLVRSDGAEHHWRLGSPLGETQSPDAIGADPLTLPSTAKAGIAGTMREDRDTAVLLGADAATSATEVNTTTTTVEGWFKLSTGRTGLVAGLTSPTSSTGSGAGTTSTPTKTATTAPKTTDSQSTSGQADTTPVQNTGTETAPTGTPSTETAKARATETPATETQADTTPGDSTPGDTTPATDEVTGTAVSRALYVDSAGRLRGGLTAEQNVLTSPSAVTDGTWHHAALVVSADRISLVLDGAVVDSATLSTAPTETAGHWTVGGAAPAGWPQAGTVGLTGGVDEVAVYPTALTAAQLSAHAALRAP